MSDRIDEYHGDEAKVLTTDEVERWQEFLGDGFQLRRTLATTRALEKAEAELDSAMFARDRYANTIGLIESAVGFSGANPVEETIEHVRRLKAERDEAIARAEKAETKAAADAMRDWDSLRQEFEANVTTLRARAEKAERERDEAMCLAYVGEHRFEDQTWKARCEGVVAELRSAERERDAARTLVSELETALEAIVCHWDASDEGKVRPGEIDAARAVLAKAKGGGT